MAITAQMVKELRERTGVGMMDCKTALQETNGDLEAAVRKAAEVLRAGEVVSITGIGEAFDGDHTPEPAEPLKDGAGSKPKRSKKAEG